jgi:hypothetical protein
VLPRRPHSGASVPRGPPGSHSASIQHATPALAARIDWARKPPPTANPGPGPLSAGTSSSSIRMTGGAAMPPSTGSAIAFIAPLARLRSIGFIPAASILISPPRAWQSASPCTQTGKRHFQPRPSDRRSSCASRAGSQAVIGSRRRPSASSPASTTSNPISSIRPVTTRLAAASSPAIGSARR